MATVEMSTDDMIRQLNEAIEKIRTVQIALNPTGSNDPTIRSHAAHMVCNSLQGAINCANAALRGFSNYTADDWHIPTIDEIREKIRNENSLSLSRRKR